jgi:hypothetical protein
MPSALETASRLPLFFSNASTKNSEDPDFLLAAGDKGVFNGVFQFADNVSA